MQPTEALQSILAAAEKRALVAPTQTERDDLAQAHQLCKSFLDTAVPLARFRCYVTIESVGPKSRLGLGDFTICGTSIPAIKNGLTGLRMEKVSARILLWELQQEKADMISGYQGDTKTLPYRNWLADIDRHEVERVTQA